MYYLQQIMQMLTPRFNYFINPFWEGVEWRGLGIYVPYVLYEEL